MERVKDRIQQYISNIPYKYIYLYISDTPMYNAINTVLVPIGTIKDINNIHNIGLLLDHLKQVCRDNGVTCLNTGYCQYVKDIYYIHLSMGNTLYHVLNPMDEGMLYKTLVSMTE